MSAERLTDFVAANPAAVSEYVASFPPEQRTGRLSHIWRALGKDRDAAAAKAAKSALANLVVSNAKAGRDVKYYRATVQQCFESGLGDVALDAEWATAKDRQNSADLEKLQVALGQAQNALSKDSIRVALANISEHYFASGDVNNAMKHVARSREVCTTPEHTAAYCLQGFRFAAFHEPGSNLPMAAPYVQRMEQVSEALGPIEYARAKVCAGLIALDKRNYRQAVNCFTQVRSAKAPAGTTLDFAAVVSPLMRVTDFAQIVAVLALSQLERASLERFLENPDFKVLFESEAELRSAVTSFFECKYYAALSGLQKFSANMRLDVFLAPHVQTLLQTVRSKAIRQYVSPFVTVELRKMADTFHTSVEQLENEVATMIRRREIDARIDKTQGALHATHSDPKEQASLRAADLAAEYVEDTEAALRVFSMLRNNVVVVANQQPPAALAGGPAGAGAAAAAAGGAAAQPMRS